MTFQDKYDQCNTWHEKVTIMELFYLTMRARNPKYSVAQMARETGFSVGLISENLNLAEAIHNKPDILTCLSRKQALTFLRK